MGLPPSPVRAAAPWLAALAGGGIYAAAQPDRGAVLLAPVCLTPLLAAMEGGALPRRALLGWCYGTAASLLLVAEPTGLALARYFGWPEAPGLLLAAGAGQLFGAVPFAVFAVLAGATPGPLRTGLSLAGSEFVRSQLFTGLPWGLLAYALAPVPELAWSASLGGVWLLSALLAACSAAAHDLLRGRIRRGLLGFAGAGLALALGPLAGGAGGDPPGSVRTIAQPAGAPAGALRVRLVQGNVPAAARRGPGEALASLDELVRASRGEGLDLAVWPESALPVVLPANLELLARRLRGEAGLPRRLLLGAPFADPRRPGPPSNAALVVDGRGGIVAVHEKVKLVPLTEYLPWPLPELGLRGPRTRPGARARSLDLGGVRIGALVCYEVLFPGIGRELVRDGARLLVNLSNDEWFGGTRGVEQHFAASVLRAIELRRPVLRATNTGITAAIDARGRVVARLPVERPGVLDVEVVPSAERPPSLFLGDAVALAGLLLPAALLLRDGLRRHG